ncbi:MAG: lysine--tRNA ligase [Desulfobacteraceae bacterium]|nr:lysine--tRNA ligase [Desulfobacteraceae bacterium]
MDSIEEIKNYITSKKLWPFGEAEKVLKRHNYDPERIYTFETGFGPSGFPHIGTFGEVVRTEFIINALKEAGLKTKLIVFSDDLDGLRKVPDDMPEWLGEHLGKPVSSIPDPYEKTGSFSEHMNSKLEEMLNWMDMDYEFKSSKQCYENGEFDDAIRILLKNYDKLEKIIAPTLSKETLQNWYPFFPICEKCGNVLTTMVKKVNLEDYTVEYSCSKSHGTLNGCGYEGVQTALKGHGKMTWRVDWPMRWYALDVDYELYGKDLIESFKIGKKIMNQIFRTKEPENMFYEMFLDENGAKISKSKGKGLTVEGWLKYGTVESLYLLMYRRPRKAKELSFNIIPSYVDDVISLSSGFHDNPDLKEHEFNFITRFCAKEKNFPKISYMLVCNLMAALKSDDSALIKNYLSQQKDLTEQDIESDFFNDIIEKAGRYYHDFVAGKKHELKLSDEDIFLLGQFVGLLHTELTSEEIHNSVYAIARKNGRNPGEFFKLIYSVFIGQDRGPRIGNFVKMIGQEKSVEIISSTLKPCFSGSQD